MIILVRVDDRLLHGQIICAWVPFTKATSLIVASDEAASDSLVAEIIQSCGCNELDVYVKSVPDTIRYIASSGADSGRVILVTGDLKDAMRVYEGGMRFASINLGNIHHEDDGRRITSSVVVNREDEELIERFRELGVRIDIRDIPASEPAPYISREKGTGVQMGAEGLMEGNGGSIEKAFKIKNKLGLHARAASLFVQLANRFSADIFVAKNGQEVNGKSIMGILILAAAQGSEIIIKAVGSDAVTAMDALGELIETGFGED